VKLQTLVPAVEHAEETDLRAKVPGIAGDFEQGLGARVEEQVIDEPLVLECERGQLPRQSEDRVDIASGQRSRSRAWSQRRRALPWHRGQCLFLQELYEMVLVCPQPVQRSRCPPSAAVRQRAMASNTFWCCQFIHL